MELSRADLEKKLGFQLEKNLDFPANLANLISTDSRCIGPGQWFLPLSGPHFDGHNFINQAMAKGASGFFYESTKKEQLSADLRLRGIELSNSLKDLQALAKLWRRQSRNGRIVALTGSSGKTTVKEILGHLLEECGPTLVTPSSFNNEIGLPLTLCQLKAEHRFSVLEMGARHPGDIAFLCELASPDVALLLNVGQAHIGEFGSYEKLRQTKLEIFTSTPRSTIAVCPSDDLFLLEAAKKSHDQVLSFGLKAHADVQVLSSYVSRQGANHFTLRIAGECYEAQMPLYHEALVINALAALATGLALRVDIASLLARLESFRGVPRRFELHHCAKHLVIDDSYNANPQSMVAGLRSIQRGFSAYRPILILGDMLELGETSVDEHRRLGSLCAALKPQLLVTVGSDSAWIGKAAEAKGLAASKIKHYAHIDSLKQDVNNIVEQGNLLYVKGSNGIKLYQIVDDFIAHNRK